MFKIAKSDIFACFVFIIIGLILVGKDFNRGEFYHPDEARHAMDGVFIYDLIKDHPHPSKLVDYAVQYYGRYPAIAIGHYPPFFGIVEAILFGIFGISVFSARLGVFSFLIVGSIFLYRFLREMYYPQKIIPLFSVLFYMTTPFVVYLSKSVMLEVPTMTMIILSIYYFHRYLDSGRISYIYIFTFFSALALLTKQISVFILPLFFAWFLLSRKYYLLRGSHLWINIGIFAVFLSIYGFFIYRYNRFNFLQVFGNYIKFPSRWSAESWLYFIKMVFKVYLTPVLSITSLAGLILVLFRFEKREAIFIIWFFVSYIFFSYIVHKEPRMNFYWIPCFCIFSSLFIRKIFRKNNFIAVFALLGIFLYQFVLAFHTQVPLVSGYRRCAQFVSGLGKGNILFNGWLNGNFIFFVRQNDTYKQRIILRASKMISVFASTKSIYYKDLLISKREIKKMIKDCGVRYVVIESRIWEDTRGFKALRQLLSEDREFVLLRRVPLTTTHRLLRGVSLLVYEYKGYEPPKRDYVDLEIFLVGRKIRVPLR